MPQGSSRERFDRYIEETRERWKSNSAADGKSSPDAEQSEGHSGKDAKATKKARNSRSFGQLLGQFLGLLRGHRRALALALGTLTVATLLKLAPPFGLKLAIDYVLPADAQLPAWTEGLPLPAGQFPLLVVIAICVLIITFTATSIHLWGRWLATKTVNRVQVMLRRRVFEHAVRLPLHRVYQLKSGGAASLLREDAGGVAELIFSMIYNPWRAIIQLVGSLIILVCVDWRLMLGGLLLIPAVYFTHRTWISRIRPLYRDVRSRRQSIDGYATEAFGGMRIVRGFTREKGEAGRFVSGNNLLVRQQLFVWWWARLIEVVWDVLIPLASTALLVYGGYQILQGQMTMGDLTMFLFYLAMLLEPLATLATSATSFQNNLAGLDRVLDLLEEPNELAEDHGKKRVERQKVDGSLTLRDVSFRYPAATRMC